MAGWDWGWAVTFLALAAASVVAALALTALLAGALSWTLRRFGPHSDDVWPVIVDEEGWR